MSLTYYVHLHTGEKLKNKKRKVIDQLAQDRLKHDIYLVALVSGKLEAFSSKMRKQAYFKERSYFVVGLAYDYEESKEVICDIVAKVYMQDKEISIAEFIMSRQQQYESEVM